MSLETLPSAEDAGMTTGAREKLLKQQHKGKHRLVPALTDLQPQVVKANTEV